MEGKSEYEIEKNLTEAQNNQEKCLGNLSMFCVSYFAIYKKILINIRFSKNFSIKIVNYICTTKGELIKFKSN